MPKQLEIYGEVEPRCRKLIKGLCASYTYKDGTDLSDFISRVISGRDHGNYGAKLWIVLKDRGYIESVMGTLRELYPFLKMEKEGVFFSDKILICFPDTWESEQFLGGVTGSLDDVSMPVTSRRTIVVVADGSAPLQTGTIPCFTISKARQLFQFPPNHPTVRSSYAMIDVYPDTYVPMSGFHDYYKQRKHQAFIELCASLGAKEIDIASAEINNRSLNIQGDVAGPLSSLGLGINAHENSRTGMKVAFRFSESNKGIKNYDSPWLRTEPSWMAMNNSRRQNHLSELGAEFNCTDEMGIDANFAAKFAGVGINIGGKFTEMTKIRLSYHVIFWD